MVEDLSKFIESSIDRIRNKHCSDDRLSHREDTENSAKRIIEENLGELDESQIEEIMTKINTDYYDGEEKIDRFGMTFRGSNQTKILSNDVEDLNSMFEDLYERGEIESAERWLEGLDGVGEGMVSSLLYLHDKERYNVMLTSMKKGLKEIYEDLEFSSDFEKRYEEYNEKINDLKDRFGFQPQEIDIIFTVLYDKEIFFAPSNTENLEKSVLNPVKISELDQEEITEDIPEHIPSEFYLWGVKPTDRLKDFWGKVEYQDLLLFYEKGQDTPRSFEYCARVLDKMEHEGIAKEVWGKDDDTTWGNLIILDDPLKINLPISEFLNKVEYEEGFYPQGFSRIDPRKIDIRGYERKKKG